MRPDTHDRRGPNHAGSIRPRSGVSDRAKASSELAGIVSEHEWAIAQVLARSFNTIRLNYFIFCHK